MRVLLIDDDKELRNVLTAGLERAGHAVFAAKDGGPALTLATDNDVDVVVTDILMPTQEGIETIMLLKKARPATPIVAMSGGGRLNGELVLELANGMGADATISKPFRIQELLDAIEAVTGGPATA